MLGAVLATRIPTEAIQIERTSVTPFIPFSISAHTCKRPYRWRSAGQAARQNASRAANAPHAVKATP